jgi:hypothetical protein
MSPLFGNKVDKADKAAKEAAAAAECERLVGLPVADLAAEILPGFGPDGVLSSGRRSGPLEVIGWLMSSYPNGSRYRQPLLQPVLEGLQALEHAGLVTKRAFGSSSQATTYHATRLGETSIADGSVREKLGAA